MTAPIPLTPGLINPMQLSQPQPGSSPEELRNVARQFEAILMEMVLKQMRSATEALSGEKQDMAADIYSGWFDQQVAAAVVQSGGVGLAEALHKQLVQQYGK